MTLLSIPGRRPSHAVPGPTRIRGLYAITPEESDTDRLLMLVRQAIRGGSNIVQYRSKTADATLRQSQAQAIAREADLAGIPLIINDDVELALRVGAAGVHIGGADGDPAAVRSRLGPNRLLGVSCYNDLAKATSVLGVADYVAFGSVFASATKPAAVRAPLSLFDEATRLGLVTVAIGGINAENAPSVIKAGAQALAVISEIFSAENPEHSARRLAQIFTDTSRG